MVTLLDSLGFLGLHGRVRESKLEGFKSVLNFSWMVWNRDWTVLRVCVRMKFHGFNPSFMEDPFNLTRPFLFLLFSLKVRSQKTFSGFTVSPD